MQKSIREIVEETRQYYTEDPSRRGMLGHQCLYIVPDTGSMCAVGRCMLPEVVEYIEKAFREDGVLENLPNDGRTPDLVCADASTIAGVYHHYDGGGYPGCHRLDTVLREEYRGHPEAFWVALQQWHDAPSAWENSTISLEENKRLMNRALAFAPVEN
jgi:hypothetical protein